MPWVRRTPTVHACEPPTVGNYTPRPDGQLGDLWRCECGRLWQIWVAGDFGLTWLAAGWWERFRYRRHR